MSIEERTTELTTAELLFPEQRGQFDVEFIDRMIGLWVNIKGQFGHTHSNSYINDKKAVEVLAPIVWSTINQHKNSPFLWGYRPLITTANNILNPKRHKDENVDFTKIDGYMTFRFNPQIQMLVDIPRVFEEYVSGNNIAVRDMRFDLFANCIVGVLMKIQLMHLKDQYKSNKLVA